MLQLLNSTKSNQKYAEDSQFSPVLNPNQSPKEDNMKKDQGFKDQQYRLLFPQQQQKIQFSEDNKIQQLSSLTQQTTQFLIKNDKIKENTHIKLNEKTSDSTQTKSGITSPQKVWTLAANIFNKHLSQIKSINQQQLSNQQAQKLKEKIIKHVNDCIALLKLQMKQIQRQQLVKKLEKQNKLTINNNNNNQSNNTIQQQQQQQAIILLQQQNSTKDNENNNNEPEIQLDLIYFCIQALQQLSKNQTNLSDAITLMEKLFSAVEEHDFVTSLPCYQNLQLFYGQILLRCGLLKKVERCLVSLESVVEQAESQNKTQNSKEKQIENQNNNKNINKSDEKFDLQKYYYLNCEYLREQDEVQRCEEEYKKLKNTNSIDAFLLKISILIDKNQLDQAIYLIEQGKLLFQRHKQPLVFFQLMNYKLRVYLIQQQYIQLHSLFTELKELYEQTNLIMTIEFCQSLNYEIQAYIQQNNINESLNNLEILTNISKEILKDRYNQSSIIGDIYYFKALSWYNQSQNMTENQTNNNDDDEKSKLIKHAISICQLCIKIRKNYLYSKLDKNQKVIDTLSLHINLLACSNQNRECRKASAELVEYELI